MFKFSKFKFLRSLDILNEQNPQIKYHYPVMYKDVLERVQNFQKKNLYENISLLDCTIGTGGHSSILLEQIQNIKILGLDLDERMIKNLPQNIVGKQDNFINFLNYKPENGKKYFDILFADLGYNIHQIYNDSYGLSYKNNSNLDMRYSQNLRYTAADILNNRTQQELRELFYIYGNITKANLLSQKIVEKRINQQFKNANDLIEILNEIESGDSIMQAFQALRIAVNQEIKNLNQFLENITKQKIINDQLILIITFHSLEVDTIQKFISQNKKKFNYKIIKPKKEEINENPRSRSAKMFELIYKSN